MIINRWIKLLENESQAKQGKQLGISQAGQHRANIDDFPLSLFLFLSLSQKKKKPALFKKLELFYIQLH